jgi:hypothetical protein
VKKPRLARSFKRNNGRRGELIRRDIEQQDLTPEEKAELAALEEWCDDWVDKRHPLPDLPWLLGEEG